MLESREHLANIARPSFRGFLPDVIVDREGIAARVGRCRSGRHIMNRIPDPRQWVSEVTDWNCEGEDSMKLRIALGIACLLAASVVIHAQATRTVTFDQDRVGAPPQDFSTALTGQGKPGVWVVMKDAQSPDRGNVLAQTDADPTDYRFPVCVLNDVSTKDLDLSVMFKAVTGRGDQAAGLVWRYKDANNYYIVRANALEHNVVLYKVQNGRRTDLPLKGAGRTYGKKVTVPSSQWSTLRVTAAGTLFTVYLNGEKLYDVEDSTFADAGKVGVWTKADSVTYFDNLSVTAK
jgi:hypothetical protein